jgi:hypothetical protein
VLHACTEGVTAYTTAVRHKPHSSSVFCGSTQPGNCALYQLHAHGEDMLPSTLVIVRTPTGTLTSIHPYLPAAAAAAAACSASNRPTLYPADPQRQDHCCPGRPGGAAAEIGGARGATDSRGKGGRHAAQGRQQQWARRGARPGRAVRQHGYSCSKGLNSWS